MSDVPENTWDTEAGWEHQNLPEVVLNVRASGRKFMQYLLGRMFDLRLQTYNSNTTSGPCRGSQR